MSKMILPVMLACAVVLVARSPVAFAQQENSTKQGQQQNKDEKKDQGKNPGKGDRTVSPLSKAHLRVSRETDNMPEIIRFYRDGLGFEIIDSFDHRGYEGVMFGHKGQGYHLEITHHRGHKVGGAPNPENLLAFYLPDKAEWQRAVDRMLAQGYKPVSTENSFWTIHGKVFEDADGYRVALTQLAWSN